MVVSARPAMDALRLWGHVLWKCSWIPIITAQGADEPNRGADNYCAGPVWRDAYDVGPYGSIFSGGGNNEAIGLVLYLYWRRGSARIKRVLQGLGIRHFI